MKATELRLGNLTKQGRVMTIDCITDTIQHDIYIQNLDTFELVKYKDFRVEPIPLTEEWLLKFGFVRKGRNSEWLTIFTPSGKALADLKDGFFRFTGVTIEIPIKYVHQLQNLYFALTGEELTLKQ